MKLNLASKIFGVFLCLYIFLIGISALSKSISGLTEPENLVAGDMAQLKKITIIDNSQQTVTKKKVWVKITSAEEDGSYG